jgi:hypothetical protein
MGGPIIASIQDSFKVILAALYAHPFVHSAYKTGLKLTGYGGHGSVTLGA